MTRMMTKQSGALCCALLALHACSKSADDGGPAGGSQPSAGAAGQSQAGAPVAGGAGQGAGGRVEAGAGTAGSAGSGPTSAGNDGAGTAGAPQVDAAPLSIFWIDVEGGAATLLVAPTGETILVDTGFGGDRDAGRIAQVLQEEAGAARVDYLITTHYHTDHVGGVQALSALLPIERFYDHGSSVESGQLFDTYVQVAGEKRTTVNAGDILQLGALTLTFVTSAGKVIDAPLPGGGPNPLCPSDVVKDRDGGAENAQSIGFVARFGDFDFVDLGDLTWAVEQLLMCPTSRLGPVDLYQTNHHGMDISNSPQLVHALAPSVAVMNNGASKGGSPATFEVLRSSPGLSDVWAMHQVTGNDAEHNAAPELTANLAGPDAAHFISAVVQPGGAYTLTNSRNGTSKTYVAR
jgi:competence protein ComEC